MAKIKQKQEDGTEIEVEVFTPEEMNTKLQEKDKEWETKMTEKDTSLQTILKEKEELDNKIKQAELDGMKDDHPNFKVLKEALSKKDSEIQSIKTELDTDRKQRIQDALDSKIKIAVKGDTELEKKVKLHLSTTLSSMKEDTEEAREKKLEAAFKLSSDITNDGPGIFDGGMGNGRGNEFKPGNGSGVEFTSREKALGAKLGITDEDYKKYGPRVSKKS